MAVFQDTLVLDVREPANRNVFFRPLGRLLETEIQQAKAKRNLGNKLSAIGGVLPGERLTVDFKTLTYSITHKLNLKENAEMRAAIKRLMAADPISPENVGTFGNDQEGSFSSEDVATWLWHINQLVNDLGHLELVRGKLPSEEEILKMGRIRRSNGHTLPEKFVDRYCWIDKTPSDDKQLAGAK